MASAGPIDARRLVAKVKTLINSHSKAILKREGLAVSGVKAAMQQRIIDHIMGYSHAGNQEGLHRMRILLEDPDASISASSSPVQFHSNVLPTAQRTTYNMPNGIARPQPSFASYGSGQPINGYGPGTYSRMQGQVDENSVDDYQARPNFKESPFYAILDPLGPVLECKVREQTRDTVECKIALNTFVADRLHNRSKNNANYDSSLKVMVYCASEPVSPFSKVDICFPHQVEIKVNGGEVKANLRGLKNKPGSTRPADITDMIRPKAGYENTLSVTYALTNKRFYTIVNLVKQHHPEALVAKLKSGESISKDQVIREMVSKAQDSDIVATSSIMSLKCPLSTLRIDTPCRSTICTHNQCFDALSFLQLQEQAPTWTCPVCNKTVSFEALQIDHYVNDILMSTSRSVDQVTVEPDGRWSQVARAESPPRSNGKNASSDDDDDLVEIQEVPRVAAVKDESTRLYPSMTQTPPYSSREQSTASAAPRTNTGKRPASQTIDLTLSSDEDELPIRAPKRQMTGYSSTLPGINSLPNGNSISNLPVPVSFNLPRPVGERLPSTPDYVHNFGSPS